ncbi:MAG: hypothetical protein GYB26_12515 [Gammaproteobacteria bacterium]|uniref:Uncharacterized protein n=1 Tax=Marinobacter litoralis TaxID=187981 RepID=A0A3M2RH96_9GAMM|nr:hypothetical protein [Marinobacter litoralis]MBR9871951.1 hypothetical protein [Gammaproteobacteria bacterium]RMJ04584.1 hypothetical protein DOQ08_01907 [Marinobacter litoralis]
MRSRYGFLIVGLVTGLAAGTLPASAESMFIAQPLTDPELAAQRGGFMLDNLEISIGLEQIMSVNGDTLAVNRLTIPNLNQVLDGGGVQHQVESMLSLINSGQAGQALVSTSSASGGWMTLIQNDLNGAVIQNVRQLNIELNNLGTGYRIPDHLRNPSLQFLGR